MPTVLPDLDAKALAALDPDVVGYTVHWQHPYTTYRFIAEDSKNPDFYLVKRQDTVEDRRRGQSYYKLKRENVRIVRPELVSTKIYIPGTTKTYYVHKNQVPTTGKTVSEDDLLTACDMFVKSHVPVASIPMYEDFLLDLVLFMKEQYE